MDAVEELLKDDYSFLSNAHFTDDFKEYHKLYVKVIIIVKNSKM